MQCVLQPIKLGTLWRSIASVCALQIESDGHQFPVMIILRENAKVSTNGTWRSFLLDLDSKYYGTFYTLILYTFSI